MGGMHGFGEILIEEYDWNPRADLARRGVLEPEVLPGYWFRDDALALFDAIGEYVTELVGAFYCHDDDVRCDAELLAWARELVADDGARVAGTPVTAEGRLESVADLVRLLQHVVYTVSAEHGAMNNGQWDQFGYVPNTPGSLFMPPPTSKHMTNEALLVYAMPGYRSAIEQMAMVHMLSAPTLTPLGSYPDEFFLGSRAAEHCVDRFRSGLDDIAFAIEHRNCELPPTERYTYLVPSDVGRSITI